MKRTLALICCLLWMGFIFYQSSKTATESNEMSHEIVNQISNQIKPSQSMEENKVEGVMPGTKFLPSFETLNVIIRKSAHAFEFGVLAVLLAWVFIEYGYTSRRLFAFTMIGVSLYAVSDEFHQLFVEGRSARLFDVMVDCIGGIVALFILSIGFTLKKMIRKG